MRKTAKLQLSDVVEIFYTVSGDGAGTLSKALAGNGDMITKAIRAKPHSSELMQSHCVPIASSNFTLNIDGVGKAEVSIVMVAQCIALAPDDVLQKAISGEAKLDGLKNILVTTKYQRMVGSSGKKISYKIDGANVDVELGVHFFESFAGLAT